MRAPRRERPGAVHFTDEVGKSITQQNDYFYPLAASIIYVVFLLTLVWFLHVRRVARTLTEAR